MSAPSSELESPIQWGDRVDHKKFGLGTVKGEPDARSGASQELQSIEHKGWAVPVTWDDPTREDSMVMSTFLKVVSRPDAKGGAYWNHEFQKLTKRVLAARQATDLVIGNAFRPQGGGGAAKVQAALAHEEVSLGELAAFLERDEQGEHA
ncbi:hypothetical protein J2Y55_003704 [Bosea sp. BE125]|uniref:hypothetical protein n=1 Tax=Bosea sp. BE125 TaxID=2817909 RepID=UPI00285B639B|nr:hypothetical protein [Bosea sp. BE125]MDR6872685.1 hypothetical protein [Bosea sp. BE125]